MAALIDVSVEEAQERFDELIDRALAGDDVTIGGIARIIPFVPRPSDERLTAAFE